MASSSKHFSEASFDSKGGEIASPIRISVVDSCTKKVGKNTHFVFPLSFLFLTVGREEGKAAAAEGVSIPSGFSFAQISLHSVRCNRLLQLALQQQSNGA